MISQMVLEYSIHCKMEWIHKTIIDSVKSVNRFMRSPPFIAWREANYASYHPFIEILHKCVSHLQELEFNARSDATQRLQDFYCKPIKLQNFTLLNSTTILEVTPHKGHNTKMLRHVGINFDLQKLFKAQQDSELFALGDSE
jgi:hypothetical protein